MLYLSVKLGLFNFFSLKLLFEKKGRPTKISKTVSWSRSKKKIVETKVVQNISHRGRGFLKVIDNHFKAYQEFYGRSDKYKKGGARHRGSLR